MKVIYKQVNDLKRFHKKKPQISPTRDKTAEGYFQSAVFATPLRK